MEHQETGKKISSEFQLISRFQFERDKKLLKANGRGVHEVLRQIKPSEFKVSSLVQY